MPVSIQVGTIDHFIDFESYDPSEQDEGVMVDSENDFSHSQEREMHQRQSLEELIAERTHNLQHRPEKVQPTRQRVLCGSQTVSKAQKVNDAKKQEQGDQLQNKNGKEWRGNKGESIATLPNYRKNIEKNIMDTVFKRMTCRTYRRQLSYICDSLNVEISTFPLKFNQARKRMGSARKTFLRLTNGGVIEEPMRRVVLVFMYWFLTCEYVSYVLKEGRMAKPAEYMRFANTMHICLPVTESESRIVLALKRGQLPQ